MVRSVLLAVALLFFSFSGFASPDPHADAPPIALAAGADPQPVGQGASAEREEAARGVREAQPPALDEEALRRAVDRYLAERDASAGRTAWERAVERLKVYGDLRLRQETDFQLDDRPDRNRQRIRLRLGANLDLNEALMLGARMVTGDPGDPNSPHQSLGDVLDSETVSLDRTYLRWQPGWLPDARLTAGKFPHPFTANPVYGELVWDDDVQPEGAVATYTRALGGPLVAEKIDLVAGEYVLLEQAGADEASVFVAQAALQGPVTRTSRAVLAVGYYHYSDATPDGAQAVFVDNAGNQAVDTNGDGKADDFRSRYEIVNPVAVLTSTRWSRPVTLSGEYILNTRAAGGEDDRGWAVGLAAGQTRAPGDWRVFYQWQVVEQEAVFTPFVQDDHLFATNLRGHIAGVQVQVAQSAELRLWGLGFAREVTSPGATTDSDRDQWRARLDINIKF